jgi:hypothetical protein
MALVAIPSWDTGFETVEAAVANRALTRIGADLIRDDTEDTPSARQSRVVFCQTRDELLRDYDFNFAQRLLTFEATAEREILLVNTTLNSRTLTRTWASIVTNSTTALTGFSGLTVNELIGVKVSGAGIPAGAYITANTATGATLSAAATASATITLTGELAGSSPGGSSVVGWTVEGTGIPDGAFIESSTGAGAILSAAATATGTITLTAALDSGPWAYSYLLPTTLTVLKVLEIDGSPNFSFEIVGASTERRILCDRESEADLLYAKIVEQVVDPAKWDPLFMDAFVLRMASKLAIPLAKRPDLSQFFQGEFTAMYSLAKKSSSEEKNQDNGDPFWTERRAKTGGIR